MPTCQHCGEDNPTRARYCMGCGSALIAAARSEEIRRVTVLFADMVGSTALIAGTDPEDARALLDTVVRRLRAAVREFDGSVVRVAGDGILALFGAPVPLEDHARRACLAAMRMQAELALAPPAAEGRVRAPVRIRVGIATGNVLLRAVASDLHVEYSAEGETTHLAAKAQQAADPGTILITAEVARLVQGFVETRAHPPLRVGGLAEPVPLHELLRVTEAESRFQVALGRGLSVLVGRTAELAQLDGAAERAGAGALAAVGVVGEAGVGKSRLLWEFRRRLQARGWSVIAAHATVSGAAIAYHPVLSVLRALYRIDPGDDAAAVGRKLADAAGSVPDLAPLLVLLDLPCGDTLWESLESRRRLERTHRALVAALLDGCRRQPTAVVIDDLHEADAETLGVLGLLLRCGVEAKLLLALEYRPERTFDLEFEQAPRLEVLRVEPLAAPMAVALFRQLVGPDSSLARLERLLVDRVAGNPFFIEEGVRMLGESGVLRGRFGDYHAPGDATHELPIPGSVRDVVESRIARLAPAARDVLQVAAVFGKEVPLPILRSLTGLGLDTLAATLGGLVDAGLLVYGGDTSAGEFAFRHAVTQEVAYGIQRKAQRQAVHTRIVELLESQPLASLPQRVELLAHHALRAHEWERAIGYLQRAARRAAERSALREAVRLLDEALGAVPRLAPEKQPVEREIDLRLALRSPLVALGQVTRVGSEVQRLEALAPACVDLSRQGRLAVFICGHRWLSGQHALAVDAGRRAIALATRQDDFSLLVPARQYVGGALHELGRCDEAEALLSANVDSVPEEASGQPFGMAGLPAVFCRATRGWLYEHLGRFDEAARDAADALRIGRSSGHGFSIMSATFTAGALHLARAEFDRAELLLAEGLALCERERQRMWLPVVGPMLALAVARQGRTAQAQALVDKAVPRPDDPVITSYMGLTIVQVYLAIGRVDAAAEVAAAMLHRTRRLGERIWEAEALWLRGEVACARQEPDAAAAEADYRAGLQLAEQLGMRPLAARCRMGLAAAHAAAGQPSAAAEQLALASQAFAALGLPARTLRARAP